MSDLKKLLETGDMTAFRAAVKSDAAAAWHPNVVNTAAATANQKALELLLKTGADLNGSYRNYRPLYNLLQTDPNKAAGKPSSERLACLERMLASGADPTEALAHAVWAGAYGLAERALAHGGSIDRATANDQPLLNDMIAWGQIPQTMWMIERGASPNVAGARGWTAVHQAASRGNARMVQAVPDAGGAKRHEDNQGSMPRDIARVTKIAEMLT
jgi:hypothetical protein